MLLDMELLVITRVEELLAGVLENIALEVICSLESLVPPEQAAKQGSKHSANKYRLEITLEGIVHLKIMCSPVFIRMLNSVGLA